MNKLEASRAVEQTPTQSEAAALDSKVRANIRLNYFLYDTVFTVLYAIETLHSLPSDALVKLPIVWYKKFKYNKKKSDVHLL